MNLLDRIRTQQQPARPRAEDRQITMDEWISYFSYQNLTYPILNTSFGGQLTQDRIPPNLNGFSEMALKRNGIVFACIATRALLFSQAQFKWAPNRSNAPGDLFTGAELQLVQQPWPRATTQDLLTRMCLDHDLAGNAYVIKRDARTLKVARPDYMTIVLGNPRPNGEIGDVDTEIIGYWYQPTGTRGQAFLPENVAHWFMHPDPICPHKGMSWLSPVIDEIMSDNATTDFRRLYFENGATPNLVVKLSTITDPAEFDEWVDKFEASHVGVRNAFKTLYLAGGADAQVVGANLKDIDFRATQAHGETRIAIAARIPAVLLGISEGLDASTYTNYDVSKDVLADGTMWPMWRSVCGKLGQLLPDQPGAHLDIDPRLIPWLRAGAKAQAEIQQIQAATIASLITAGFNPDAAVTCVMTGDLSGLQHSGLVSVQLLPPGITPPAQPAPNGNGNAPAGAPSR